MIAQRISRDRLLGGLVAGVERVGEHAPVTAGGIGLQAQQRGRRPVLELLRQPVERVRRGLSMCARNAAAPSCTRPAWNSQRMSAGVPSSRRCSSTIPWSPSSSPSRVLDMPGRRDCGRNRTSSTRLTPAASSSATSSGGNRRS